MLIEIDSNNFNVTRAKIIYLLNFQIFKSLKRTNTTIKFGHCTYNRCIYKKELALSIDAQDLSQIILMLLKLK